VDDVLIALSAVAFVVSAGVIGWLTRRIQARRDKLRWETRERWRRAGSRPHRGDGSHLVGRKTRHSPRRGA